MAFGTARAFPRTQTAAEYDAGLRAHMLRIYNYMVGALVITGLVAYATAGLSVGVDPATGQTGLTAVGQALFLSPLKWVVMLAPLGFVLALTFGIQRMSFGTLQMVFWLFSVAMGLSLATVFLTFTGTSIARVFFVTAATFAAVSLWGYTTKRDLTNMGTFLFMGLIGIVIASLVNIFIGSTALQFAISVIGVLVFTGLTAFDTQRAKLIYDQGHDHDTAGKLAVMSAVGLYLNFVNLFVILLQFLGVQRQ